MNRARAVLASCLCALLPACTTIKSNPSQPQWVTRAAVIGSGTSGVDPRLPPPAAAALQAVELGTIPYDSLTLPLIAPDGRFVATQVGPAPEWPEVFAEPASTARLARRRVIEIYSLGDQPPAKLTSRLPIGVLLGRSAIEQGFLVEQPGDAPGSRRIGLAPWTAQKETDIAWLTPQGPTACAAFGVLGANGELAFSSRANASAPWTLHVRSNASDPGSQRECVMPGASLVFAMFEDSSHPRCLYALAVPFPAREDLPLLMVRFDLDTPGRQLPVAAAGPIAPTSGMFDAFQCVAAAQTPNPGIASGGWGGPRGALAYSAGAQAMAWVEPVASNVLSFKPLQPGVFAAIWGDASAETTPFVIGSTPADLVFQDLVRSPIGVFGPPRLVRPGKSIPRRTNDPKQPYLMLMTLEPFTTRALGIAGLASKNR